MKKIVVGSSSFGAGGNEPIDLMSSAGYEVVVNPYNRKMTEDEIIDHLQGAEGLLAGLEPLNERVFSNAPQLKAIARIGIGMDNVDIEAAKKHGIKISNTPDGPSYAVAEMTFAALMTIARQIVPTNNDIHSGIWKKHMGFSICGISVLLIGYGRIAHKLEEMLKAFQVNIMASDPRYPELAKGSLEDMLAQADVVSLHASGKDVIINRERLNVMKPGSILLNSARGGLVDENALYDTLKSGKLSWYWADSFKEEPYSGKLTECKNALLTPHIATYTGLCRRQMETQAVRNILEDLKNV